MTAAIEIDQVSKRFGSLQALDRVSLQIKQGLQVFIPKRANHNQSFHWIAIYHRNKAGGYRFALISIDERCLVTGAETYQSGGRCMIQQPGRATTHPLELMTNGLLAWIEEPLHIFPARRQQTTFARVAVGAGNVTSHLKVTGKARRGQIC